MIYRYCCLGTYIFIVHTLQNRTVKNVCFFCKRDHNISHFKSGDYFPIRISLEILYMKEEHSFLRLHQKLLALP